MLIKIKMLVKMRGVIWMLHILSFKVQNSYLISSILILGSSIGVAWNLIDLEKKNIVLYLSL